MSDEYAPVTSETADKLRQIVGEKYVVFDDAEKLEPYSHDEVAEQQYAHAPECLVRPETAEQIAEIMKLANRQRIAVTPRGAGSGLSGGAVPLYGGIVLFGCLKESPLAAEMPREARVIAPPHRPALSFGPTTRGSGAGHTPAPASPTSMARPAQAWKHLGHIACRTALRPPGAECVAWGV